MNDRQRKLLEHFSDAPDDLVFWAFRYFLGRCTIHTCCFAKELAEAWRHLDKRVADMIKNELEKEFERDDIARAEGEQYKPLGWDCDRAAWEKVREAYLKKEKE